MSSFLDYVEIEVESGRGGDGVVSWRRQKYVPHGGPEGGDGGRGGSVVLVADQNRNTLLDFRHRQLYRAPKGSPGGGAKRSGRAGEDLVLAVPVGTVVREREAILADLSIPGQRLEVARGGRGGRGNQHFATATRQAPSFCEPGQPSERRQLILELKLLAHLGIVGCPNAGKSSLISRLSNCKPAIGDYPFTTLTPNLGILKLSDLRALTLVDVPGLIRGACAGKGLGKQFLRHIERCRALLHVLDGSLSPAELRRDLDTVRDELAAAGIFPEAVIIVVNKADTIPDLDQRSRIRDQLPGEKAAFVSSVTGEGISELLETIRQLDRSKDLTAMPAAQAATPPPTADYSAREAACVLEVPAEGVFRVRGSEVEGWARVTDTSDWQSLNQLLKVLDRLGALESLTEAGVESGDTVIVGNKEFVWSDYAQDKLV